jgi:hypothetical protein
MHPVAVSFAACRCSLVVVSSKEEREKESGDRSMNGYLRLPLTCPLLSVCCCWKLYLCRSQEWAQHSPSPAGFVYLEFSCARATATRFPLSKHTGGGDTAPAFSGLRVYLQFPTPVEFSSHCHFYKLSHSWLLGVCCCSCLLWLACEGFPLPPSLALRAPYPLCYVSFLLLLLIIQCFFFPFFLGGCQSVQGAMLIWPRVVCGSTMCRLAHLVVCVFQAIWAPTSGGGTGATWFFCLTWSGDAMCRLEAWRSHTFASSWWFFL